MIRNYLVLAFTAFVLLSIRPVFAYLPAPPPPTIGDIVSELILSTLIGFFILIAIVGFILSLIKKESKKAIGIFLVSIVLFSLYVMSQDIISLRTYRVIELPIYFSILASFVLSGIVFYRKWTRAFWILLSISMALGIISFIYFTITFNS